MEMSSPHALADNPHMSFAEARRIESLGVRTDLERLRAILDDAVGRLLASFESIQDHLDNRRDTRCAAQCAAQCFDPRAGGIDGAVQDAVQAMQFHDMASQLMSHVERRMDYLVQLDQTMAGGGDVPRAPAPGPVAQAAMDGGGVILF
jgi:CHAD domain-containing protein